MLQLSQGHGPRGVSESGVGGECQSAEQAHCRWRRIKRKSGDMAGMTASHLESLCGKTGKIGVSAEWLLEPKCCNKFGREKIKERYLNMCAVACPL